MVDLWQQIMQAGSIPAALLGSMVAALIWDRQRILRAADRQYSRLETIIERTDETSRRTIDALHALSISIAELRGAVDSLKG